MEVRGTGYAGLPTLSACGTHTTDAERAEYEDRLSYYRAGEKYGRESERSLVEYVRKDLEKAEKKLRKFEKAASEQGRNYGKPGAQLVTIDHRLGYRWRGADPLKVGDKVWLPKTWFMHGDWIGEVTSLGSLYDGAHVDILHRAD